ncbi:DUF1963 domain-containing protein [Sphaerisporangium sp. TRM90804]|uniref:DUF1963 domain-containing protein n=1 Tax=Sphaerisporangium sp. TRM90804 TaxID=3031113 RepID=UPI00244D35AD|nr:DUF1963 domain-containing protein [Sphaerisporangium sp. TRM90804]MDH2430044.1 DUF1963 domain-containing protein [Sphaerisporangium sp. TRM90804]
MRIWLRDYAAFVREKLPAETAERLIELARPAIRLSRASEGDEPVGRLGGTAVLPPTMEVPPGMALAVELDCARLNRYEVDIALPADGTLLFFTELEGDRAEVVYLPVGTAVVPRPAPYEHPELPLTASTVATWPEGCQPVLVQAFGGVPETYEAVWHHDDFAESIANYGHDAFPGPLHQVGGYSVAFQNPVEAEAAQDAGAGWYGDPTFFAEASQWVTLLQLAEDTDADMIWGDGAFAIWAIRADALAARDFEKTYFYLQGH